MQWVTPRLVAQIRFVEWTAEGRLRHAAFLGMRDDKSASEVRRE
jgi:bifunctional non-homologous end joining protein LigD